MKEFRDVTLSEKNIQIKRHSNGKKMGYDASAIIVFGVQIPKEEVMNILKIFYPEIPKMSTYVGENGKVYEIDLSDIRKGWGNKGKNDVYIEWFYGIEGGSPTSSS